MQGIRKQVIAISGGCGDIGLATAKKIIQHRGRVYLLDLLDSSRGDDIAKRIGAEQYIRCDQSNRPQVDHAVDHIVQSAGRLDTVIANAAIVRRAPIENITDRDWQDYLDINLSGPFYLARAAINAFLKQTPRDKVRGRLLFTSSWTAQHPLPGNLPYVVTKGAIEAMTRAMAQELADRAIRVNALAPGLVYAGLTRKLCDTTPGLRQTLQDMVPLAELGTAEQVADAYCFLCSSMANYMTGQVLTVDGGCSVIKRTLD